MKRLKNILIRGISRSASQNIFCPFRAAGMSPGVFGLSGYVVFAGPVISGRALKDYSL